MQADKATTEIYDDFVNSPTIQKVIKKNVIHYQNRNLEFRIHKSILVLGLVITSASLGMLFFNNIYLKMIFFIMLGTPGIFLLLTGLFSKLNIDEEKITYKNPLGKSSSIFWSDVIAVYDTALGNAMNVCSKDSTIEIHSFLNAYFYIHQLFKQMTPQAFKRDALFLIWKTKDFYVKDGKLVFKIRKSLSFIIIFFFVFFWSAIIIASFFDSSPLPTHLILSFFYWNVPLIILMLYSLITRIYIGKQTISKRNFIGRIKCIDWDEIKSVKHNEREYIKVYSKSSSLRISANMAGYDLIYKLINDKRNPDK